MAIPAYLWLKDDGGNPIYGSVDVQTAREALRCFLLVTAC